MLCYSIDRTIRAIRQRAPKKNRFVFYGETLDYDNMEWRNDEGSETFTAKLSELQALFPKMIYQVNETYVFEFTLYQN